MMKKTSLNKHIKTRLLFVIICFFALLFFGFIINSDTNKNVIDYNGKIVMHRQRSCIGPTEFLPLAFLGIPIVTIGLLLDAITLLLKKNATLQKVLINILFICCFILLTISIFSF